MPLLVYNKEGKIIQLWQYVVLQLHEVVNIFRQSTLKGLSELSPVNSKETL